MTPEQIAEMEAAREILLAGDPNRDNAEKGAALAEAERLQWEMEDKMARETSPSKPTEAPKEPKAKAKEEPAPKEPDNFMMASDDPDMDDE